MTPFGGPGRGSRGYTDGGPEIFADELTRFAAQLPGRRVAAIAEQLAAPLRVGLRGRRGVGRRTVGQALRQAGVLVTGAADMADTADVVVYVVAEVAKPEDRVAVAAAASSPARPVLVVLNKVDLAGGASAADVQARLGAPAVPMSGLFALAAGADRPADVLGRAIGRAAIDRLVAGRSADEIRVRLRRLSGVDEVCRRVDAAGAVVRYRRLAEAVARLEALAVGSASGARIAAFLAGDDAVLARMAAAVEAAGATGAVEPAGPAAQLDRAQRWQRRREAPLGAVHRACAADIVRGSLRAWSGARGFR
ncbi:MAG TPA: hypothetical protein VFR17_04540 [Mycobacterium sp.]|nr:hypothetical protein [Mycobacterium sp.]